jgi:hypothetical protein
VKTSFCATTRQKYFLPQFSPSLLPAGKKNIFISMAWHLWRGISPGVIELPGFASHMLLTEADFGFAA